MTSDAGIVAADKAAPRSALELDLEALLADWRECAEGLERLPPGPEWDAVAARFDELGEKYQAAVLAMTREDASA